MLFTNTLIMCVCPELTDADADVHGEHTTQTELANVILTLFETDLLKNK